MADRPVVVLDTNVIVSKLLLSLVEVKKTAIVSPTEFIQIL